MEEEQAAEAEIIIKVETCQRVILTQYVSIVRKDIQGNAGGRQRLVLCVDLRTISRQNVHRIRKIKYKVLKAQEL